MICLQFLFAAAAAAAPAAKRKRRKRAKRSKIEEEQVESFPRRFIYLWTNCAGCMLLRLVKFQAIKFCSLLHPSTPSLYLSLSLFILSSSARFHSYFLALLERTWLTSLFWYGPKADFLAVLKVIFITFLLTGGVSPKININTSGFNEIFRNVTSFHCM
jgi:hypothetical protein